MVRGCYGAPLRVFEELGGVGFFGSFSGHRLIAMVTAIAAILVLPLIWSWALAGDATNDNAISDDAVIAVASNFRNAIDDLEVGFERQSPHTLTIVTGSTGKLYAQIMRGAPFDVLLAADRVRPELLVQSGKAIIGTQITYGLGQLILWSSDPALLRNHALDYLREGKFRRLAIANPDLAPYGVAARDVLRYYGLEQRLARKIVRGENIGQAFTLVATGNAEIGLLAKAQLAGLKASRRGSYWLLPAHSYRPIRQDGVLLSRAANNRAALAFMDYLQSPAARAIIIRHGYGI